MSLLKEVEYEEGLFFETHSSQQFATVVFDRTEDDEEALITVTKNGKTFKFIGDNTYNPSSRRRATCVYVHQEDNPLQIIKICVVQHKGTTSINIYDVDLRELIELSLISADWIRKGLAEATKEEEDD